MHFLTPLVRSFLIGGIFLVCIIGALLIKNTSTTGAEKPLSEAPAISAPFYNEQGNTRQMYYKEMPNAEPLSKPSDWSTHIRTSAPLQPAPHAPADVHARTPSEPTATKVTPTQTIVPTYNNPFAHIGENSPDQNDAGSLRTYGNTIGEHIQSAVRSMGDQNTLLLGYAEHTTEKRALYTLADQYEALSKIIRDTNAPRGFTDTANRLADGYDAVASGIRIFAESTDVYAGLLTYNEHVETFANSFIAFASLFGAHGISFNETEPGGIFTPAVSGF